MDQQSQKNFMWGALMGSVIGAATTLLLTPVSGSRLRHQVRNRIQRLQHAKLIHARKSTAPRRTSRKAPARKARRH